MTPRTASRLLAIAAAGISFSLPAADILLTPPAGGGVSFTNAAANATHFRVADDGSVTLPNLAAATAPVTGLCLGLATAKVGTCARLIHDSGASNIFVGALSGNVTMTGGNNTAIGAQSLAFNTTGISNAATGFYALGFNTTGGNNTADGHQALLNNTTGSANTATGSFALFNNTTGDQNTAIGTNALGNNTTGTLNIAIGAFAGNNSTTGTGNIIIGNPGVAGEGSTIRIGNPGQTRAFIAGIRGVTTGVADGVAVLIDSAGQLGTVSSSLRVKDDVADMEEASAALMKLRPVTFHYKEQGSASRLQYGLIAEEVESVYPGLVAKRPDGSAETVMYHYLPPMLLNEYQKQQRTIDAQAARIAELERRTALLVKALETLTAK